MNFFAWLSSQDPWTVLTMLVTLLWAVEIRFGQRSSYMRGQADGYGMAARHVLEGQREQQLEEAIHINGRPVLN